MDVYGLTGGIGSGKSVVAEMLEEYGIPVVSADELSRMVVSPGSEGLRDVVDTFGSEVVDDGGNLDRQRMAKLVFADPSKRRKLEEILHPRIRERYENVLDALDQAGHAVAVYEVPLLFEKNLEGDMTGVVLVTASEEHRIHRVRARDSITEDEVRARMAAQMDEAEKRRRANYIIDNDGDMDDLRREVESMLSRFLKLPASSTVRSDAPQGPQEEQITAPRPAAAPKPDAAAKAKAAAKSGLPKPGPKQPPKQPPKKKSPGVDASAVAAAPKPQSEVRTLPPPPRTSRTAKAGDDG